MRYQTYYDRALKVADTRYRRVFEKMGYGKAVEEVADEQDDTVEAAPKRRGRKPKSED